MVNRYQNPLGYYWFSSNSYVSSNFINPCAITCWTNLFFYLFGFSNSSFLIKFSWNDWIMLIIVRFNCGYVSISSAIWAPPMWTMEKLTVNLLETFLFQMIVTLDLRTLTLVRMVLFIFLIGITSLLDICNTTFVTQSVTNFHFLVTTPKYWDCIGPQQFINAIDSRKSLLDSSTPKLFCSFPNRILPTKNKCINAHNQTQLNRVCVNC